MFKIDSLLHFPEVSGQAVSLRMTNDCDSSRGVLAGGEAASQDFLHQIM
jgi:hypothetical protein